MARAVNPSREFSLVAFRHVIGATWRANGNEGRIRSGTSTCSNEWGCTCAEKAINAPVETVPDGPVEMYGYELYECR